MALVTHGTRRVSPAECREMALILENNAVEQVRAACNVAHVQGYDPKERIKCYQLYRSIAIKSAVKLLDQLKFTSSDLKELGADGIRIKTVVEWMKNDGE